MSIIRKAAAGKQPGSPTYVLSDATVDRYGDVIEPKGWLLDNFRRNPVALFNHDSNKIVGKWGDLRIENGQLLAEFEAAPPGTTQMADDVRRLIEANVLGATSVGFLGLEFEPIDAKRPYAGTRYTRQELLETSIVSVPANPAALHVARSMNISDETMTLAFGGQAVMGRRDVALSGGQAVSKRLSKATPMDNIQTPISRQIQDRQSMLNAARDALAELVRDPNHDGSEEDLLNEEIEQHEVALVRLQRSERSLAFRTSAEHPAPVLAAPAVARRPLGLPTKEVSGADLMFRMLRARVNAEISRDPIDKVLHDLYPEDEATASLTRAFVTRAATTGATTTGAGWLADLVVLAQGDFVNLLYPNQVFPKISGMGLALNFGPNSGAIKIPSRTATPSIGGTFVAEAAPIPVRRLGTTSITLYPHKIGVISVISKEVAAYSNPDAEALIRDSIINDSDINVDATLLDAVAVSTTRPAGLTNGVTPVTASVAHGYTAILADLQALSTPFYVANAGRKLALIMSPVQMQQLAFAAGPSGVPFGWTDQFTNMFRVISSSSITPGSVYMIDTADFVSVSGAPEFEVSEVATLHMEDTTPLQIGTPGTPPTVAAPVQSMFQTGQIAIRMLSNVSWAMRRPNMVQFMTGANWGP